MRLLFFFTQQIAPNAGGVERVVTCMYEKLRERGFDITTLFLKPFQSSKAIPNQIQLPSIDGSTKENEEYIESIIKANDYNLALNFGAIFNRSSRAFADACNATQLPLISVYHNTLDWILWLNPQTSKLMRHEWSRLLLRKIYSCYQKFPRLKNAKYYSRKSSASIVLASCYKQEYYKLIDSKPNDLRAIYNPRILPDGLTSISHGDKKNEVLFVGRLEDQKNVAELIRIWGAGHFKDWKLIIVGDGSQKVQIENMIRELNLSDSICLLGHQDNPQDYYKRAKIFAMTSKYEGFPMTLIECQSFGCVPIIYDSYPAAKEIVEDGVNGYLIPYHREDLFAEKLKELMSNKTLLQSFSNQGLNMTKRFNPDKIIEEWIEVIRKYSKKEIQ